MRSRLLRDSKGFTLVEIVVATVLFMIVTAMIVPVWFTLFSATEASENSQDAEIVEVINDMHRSFVLAQTVQLLPSGVQVEKIGGCSVSYIFTSGVLEKFISGTCSGERKLRVSGIRRFSIVPSGNLYTIVVERDGKTFTVIYRKP